MVRGASFGIVLVAALVACNEPRAPSAPPRTARPRCPDGVFAGQLSKLLPTLDRVESVALFPARDVDRKIEPGCVVPFRNEPDDRLLYVGRVVGRVGSRSKGDKLKVVGRGRLEVGRRAMRLQLLNDAGDEALTLTIDGAHVRLTEKGQKPFEADIALADDGELPLPLDALVAALDSCDQDQRLGKSEDGNIIEAKRGAFALWRSRWSNPHASAVIDTSIACTKDDARLMWRTAAGDLLPMVAVASARSDRVLVIVRQGPSETDDFSEFGLDGAR